MQDLAALQRGGSAAEVIDLEEDLLPLLTYLARCPSTHTLGEYLISDEPILPIHAVLQSHLWPFMKLDLLDKLSSKSVIQTPNA